MNITAYDGGTLVGCLRILTDGYFFGTITELLVLPAPEEGTTGKDRAQKANSAEKAVLHQWKEKARRDKNTRKYTEE